jgi:hypothetical protein
MKQSITTWLLFLISTLGFSQTMTNVGTDFWIAFPRNQSQGVTISLFISSNFSTNGSLFSSFPGVNQNFTVVPGLLPN